jgi:hypothetical protein
VAARHILTDESRVFSAVGHALRVSGEMAWQIAWSLILGFTLSAVIEALVRKSRSPGYYPMTDRAASRSPPGSERRPHPALTPQ